MSYTVISVFIDVYMHIVICPWQVKSPSVHLKGGSFVTMYADILFVYSYDVFMLLQITAKRLLLSKQTIPHYYLSLDTQVDKLLK